MTDSDVGTATALPAALKDIQQVAKEGAELWSSAAQAYVRYLLDLSQARGFGDVCAAYTDLLYNSVGLCGQAACAIQRDGGLPAPTLNDA